MGITGFGAAIGVHPAIGYTDTVHLAPAYLGFAIYIATAVRLRVELASAESSRRTGSPPQRRGTAPRC